MQLARLSRRQEPDAPDFVREYVQWGAGPRASQYMVLGAKARAVLMGRCFATYDDVRAVAPPVLRHRLKMNFNADAAGVTADDIVRRLLAYVPFVGDEGHGNAGMPNVFKSA
jgi:MoxR-like ATPase